MLPVYCGIDRGAFGGAIVGEGAAEVAAKRADRDAGGESMNVRLRVGTGYFSKTESVNNWDMTPICSNAYETDVIKKIFPFDRKV